MNLRLVEIHLIGDGVRFFDVQVALHLFFKVTLTEVEVRQYLTFYIFIIAAWTLNVHLCRFVRAKVFFLVRQLIEPHAATFMRAQKWSFPRVNPQVIKHV